MKYEVMNRGAIDRTLDLILPKELIFVIEKVYEAIDAAEQRAFQEGVDHGYDEGLRDGLRQGYDDGFQEALTISVDEEGEDESTYEDIDVAAAALDYDPTLVEALEAQERYYDEAYPFYEGDSGDEDVGC